MHVLHKQIRRLRVIADRFFCARQITKATDDSYSSCCVFANNLILVILKQSLNNEAEAAFVILYFDETELLVCPLCWLMLMFYSSFLEFI